MHTITRSIVWCMVFASFISPLAVHGAASQPPALPESSVSSTESARPVLFKLHEMDMHLHAGLERPAPLDEWIDLAVADGRKVILVLDHRELYDMTPKEFDGWIAENKFPRWYPTGREGQTALMDDLGSLRTRKDVITFRGWEIWEGELDEGLDREAMRLAEVIGWHISSNGDPAPCGKMLLKRVRQIAEVQKEFPVPMIVFHPFTAHVSRVQREAKEKGKEISSLTVEDYRFFQPGEQQELVTLLRDKSIYIEISRGQSRCMELPAIREALIADIKPLAEGGVQFTVSTDAHGVPELQLHFDPATYCEAIGVTPENANGLVRELLDRRAKGLDMASGSPSK